MFGKRKHSSSAQQVAVGGATAVLAPPIAGSDVTGGGTVPAVALLCDTYVSFTSDDALRGFAAGVLQSRSPELKVAATAVVEAAVGFVGNDDQARVELNRLLGRAMATAGIDPHTYELAFFTVRSEVPPAKVWCLAPIGPAPEPPMDIPRQPREAGAAATNSPARPQEIKARLEQIDAQLASLREQMANAVNASSDAPGGNLLIASIEEMLGHAAPAGTPTLGQVRALEQERDQLQAELAQI